MKPEQISLEEIELDDDRFRISYFTPLEPLLKSIQEVGLVSPILVTRRNRKTVLVCGWRRVLACREVGFQRVHGLILEEEDDRKAFEVAISEKLAVRSLTLVEKAEVLRKLAGFGVGVEQLRREFLPQLGIPATSEYVEKYLALAECVPEVKRKLEERNSPISVAERLVELSAEEQRLLLTWLSVLSQNKQKELLENLSEVCQREGVSVKAVLEETQIRKVFAEEGLSLRQKAGRVLNLIKARRFPQLSAWRSRLASRLKALGWPAEITLQADPYFEEEGMSISFRFRESSEFIKRLEKLRELAYDPWFGELFKPPSGE